jgi:hypothetical protein
MVRQNTSHAGMVQRFEALDSLAGFPTPTSDAAVGHTRAMREAAGTKFEWIPSCRAKLERPGIIATAKPELDRRDGWRCR